MRLIAAVVVMLAACRDASTPVEPAMSPDLATSGSRDRTPPTAPTNLRVTNVTSFSVSLAWNPSTDRSAFSYLILAAGRWSAQVPSTQTSFTWTANLEAGKSYYFIVGARDAAGNQSKFSNLVTVTLPPDVIAPSAPVVSVIDVGPTYAVLSWSSTDDGPFVFYTINRDGTPVIQGTSTTSATLTSLEPEHTYTITAQARDNGINWSPVSAPVSFTTPTTPNDVTPPSVPAGFAAWDVGDGAGEINAFWSASTDDFTPQSLIRYEVYLNGELADVTAGSWTRSVMYGVNGTNVIELRAIDAAGNRSAAATATVVLNL
jgi:hypothetical protein